MCNLWIRRESKVWQKSADRIGSSADYLVAIAYSFVSVLWVYPEVGLPEMWK